MQRTRNMQAIKSTGSIIEIKLSKALWKFGYRYRKNDKSVFGKPDITFKRYKIAIFVDSEFWHGKNWDVRKFDHKTNKKFWMNKIEGNIKRDKVVNRKLRAEGWKVLRFWGRDINKKIDKCLNKIEKAINEAKGKD